MKLRGAETGFEEITQQGPLLKKVARIHRLLLGTKRYLTILFSCSFFTNFNLLYTGIHQADSWKIPFQNIPCKSLKIKEPVTNSYSLASPKCWSCCPLLEYSDFGTTSEICLHELVMPYNIDFHNLHVQ